MNCRILVTGASAQAGRSMIGALSDQSVTVLACDWREGATPPVPAPHWFVVHRDDDPEFVGDLVTLCAQHDVDVVVPTRAGEQLALARVRSLFEGLGAQLWLAPIVAHATRSQARRILQLGEHGRGESRMGKLLRCLSCHHDA